MVSDLYAEASKKRYEYITNRINETLGENNAAILFIRENHRIQFPSDIEVFRIEPPPLDEIHRWLRERSQQAEEEPAEEPVGEETPEEVEPENSESFKRFSKFANHS